MALKNIPRVKTLKSRDRYSSFQQSDTNATIRRVVDADTVEVIYKDGRTDVVSIRFENINAPEVANIYKGTNSQYYGNESRDWLRSNLLVGQEITIRGSSSNVDAYNRKVGYVYDSPNTADITNSFNYELIEQGLASYYPYAGSSEPAFLIAQSEAMIGKKGIWGDPVFLKLQEELSGVSGNTNSWSWYQAIKQIPGIVATIRSGGDKIGEVNLTTGYNTQQYQYMIESANKANAANTINTYFPEVWQDYVEQNASEPYNRTTMLTPTQRVELKNAKAQELWRYSSVRLAGFIPSLVTGGEIEFGPGFGTPLSVTTPGWGFINMPFFGWGWSEDPEIKRNIDVDLFGYRLRYDSIFGSSALDPSGTRALINMPFGRWIGNAVEFFSTGDLGRFGNELMFQGANIFSQDPLRGTQTRKETYGNLTMLIEEPIPENKRIEEASRPVTLNERQLFVTAAKASPGWDSRTNKWNNKYTANDIMWMSDIELRKWARDDLSFNMNATWENYLEGIAAPKSIDWTYPTADEVMYGNTGYKTQMYPSYGVDQVYSGSVVTETPAGLRRGLTAAILFGLATTPLHVMPIGAGIESVGLAKTLLGSVSGGIKSAIAMGGIGAVLGGALSGLEGALSGFLWGGGMGLFSGLTNPFLLEALAPLVMVGATWWDYYQNTKSRNLGEWTLTISNGIDSGTGEGSLSIGLGGGTVLSGIGAPKVERNLYLYPAGMAESWVKDYSEGVLLDWWNNPNRRAFVPGKPDEPNYGILDVDAIKAASGSLFSSFLGSFSRLQGRKQLADIALSIIASSNAQQEQIELAKITFAQMQELGLQKSLPMVLPVWNPWESINAESVDMIRSAVLMQGGFEVIGRGIGGIAQYLIKKPSMAISKDLTAELEAIEKRRLMIQVEDDIYSVKNNGKVRPRGAREVLQNIKDVMRSEEIGSGDPYLEAVKRRNQFVQDNWEEIKKGVTLTSQPKAGVVYDQLQDTVFFAYRNPLDKEFYTFKPNLKPKTPAEVKLEVEEYIRKTNIQRAEAKTTAINKGRTYTGQEEYTQIEADELINRRVQLAKDIETYNVNMQNINGVYLNYEMSAQALEDFMIVSYSQRTLTAQTIKDMITALSRGGMGQVFDIELMNLLYRNTVVQEALRTFKYSDSEMNDVLDVLLQTKSLTEKQRILQEFEGSFAVSQIIPGGFGLKSTLELVSEDNPEVMNALRTAWEEMIASRTAIGTTFSIERDKILLDVLQKVGKEVQNFMEVSGRTAGGSAAAGLSMKNNMTLAEFRKFMPDVVSQLEDAFNKLGKMSTLEIKTLLTNKDWASLISEPSVPLSTYSGKYLRQRTNLLRDYVEGSEFTDFEDVYGVDQTTGQNILLGKRLVIYGDVNKSTVLYKSVVSSMKTKKNMIEEMINKTFSMTSNNTIEKLMLATEALYTEAKTAKDMTRLLEIYRQLGEYEKLLVELRKIDAEIMVSTIAKLDYEFDISRLKVLQNAMNTINNDTSLLAFFKSVVGSEVRQDSATGVFKFDEPEFAEYSYGGKVSYYIEQIINAKGKLIKSKKYVKLSDVAAAKASGKTILSGSSSLGSEGEAGIISQITGITENQFELAARRELQMKRYSEKATQAIDALTTAFKSGEVSEPYITTASKTNIRGKILPVGTGVSALGATFQAAEIAVLSTVREGSIRPLLGFNPSFFMRILDPTDPEMAGSGTQWQRIRSSYIRLPSDARRGISPGYLREGIAFILVPELKIPEYGIYYFNNLLILPIAKAIQSYRKSDASTFASKVGTAIREGYGQIPTKELSRNLTNIFYDTTFAYRAAFSLYAGQSQAINAAMGIFLEASAIKGLESMRDVPSKKQQREMKTVSDSWTNFYGFLVLSGLFNYNQPGLEHVMTHIIEAEVAEWNAIEYSNKSLTKVYDEAEFYYGEAIRQNLTGEITENRIAKLAGESYPFARQAIERIDPYANPFASISGGEIPDTTGGGRREGGFPESGLLPDLQRAQWDMEQAMKITEWLKKKTDAIVEVMDIIDKEKAKVAPYADFAPAKLQEDVEKEWKSFFPDLDIYNPSGWGEGLSFTNRYMESAMREWEDKPIDTGVNDQLMGLADDVEDMAGYYAGVSSEDDYNKSLSDAKSRIESLSTSGFVFPIKVASDLSNALEAQTFFENKLTNLPSLLSPDLSTGQVATKTYNAAYDSSPQLAQGIIQSRMGLLLSVGQQARLLSDNRVALRMKQAQKQINPKLARVSMEQTKAEALEARNPGQGGASTSSPSYSKSWSPAMVNSWREQIASLDVAGEAVQNEMTSFLKDIGTGDRTDKSANIKIEVDKKTYMMTPDEYKAYNYLLTNYFDIEKQEASLLRNSPGSSRPWFLALAPYSAEAQKIIDALPVRDVDSIFLPKVIEPPVIHYDGGKTGGTTSAGGKSAIQTGDTISSIKEYQVISNVDAPDKKIEATIYNVIDITNCSVDPRLYIPFVINATISAGDFCQRLYSGTTW